MGIISDTTTYMGEPSLDAVLRSAAELQRVVPDAVLVTGAAAALWAHHRDSFDHDHVLADLSARYFDVLEAVEATDGWVTSVRASSRLTDWDVAQSAVHVPQRARDPVGRTAASDEAAGGWWQPCRENHRVSRGRLSLVASETS